MLIRQTLQYLPAQFLAPAAQLVSMLVWTWWLAPAEMGAFALITATQELAYLASLSWFSIYALRYMPERTEVDARRRYLGTETTLMLLLAVPQIAAAWATLYFLDVGEPSLTAVAVVAAFYVSRSANVHHAERARAQSDILAYTILQIAGPLGGFLAGLAFVEIFGPSAISLIGAYAAAQAVGTLIALPMIGASVRPRWPDRGIVRAALGYGGPILLLSGLGWLAENNIRYVVEHHAGAATFGLLAVGWGLGRRCANFASMLVTAAAFPIAARLLNAGDRDGALNQLGVNAAMLLGILVPTVAGLAMVGDLMADLLIAEAYRETTKAVLGIATLAGALRFLHVHTTDQMLILEKRFGHAAAIDTVEIVATAGLTTVGLMTAGLTGAVIGAAAGSGLTLAVSALLAGRHGFRFLWGDFTKVGIATLVMAAVLAATPYPQSAFGLIIAVTLGAGVYGATVALFYRELIVPTVRRRLDRIPAEAA